eukprot:gene8399-6062_t
MQSISMKQQQNLPYYPYGLPNRGPTEVEDDDTHSQVLEYQPEKDEFDSFLTKCFDYTKNTNETAVMAELRAESPILDHDAEPQATSQVIASPLSLKGGSSMMLLMMMEDREPTHPPSSLSEDIETVADDTYLPSLNISSSMEYDGPRTDAEHQRGCAMDEIVEVNVTDVEVIDEVAVAPSCASLSLDVIDEETTTIEEDDAQLQALSLACKSLDTAMEEYHHFKAFLSMKSPTSASASASSGNPRPRSARTMTHLVCQQAQKRANNTTVLSTAAIEGAKEKEREREAEQARKAAKAAARKAAAATPFSPPKPTRASTLRARSVDCYDRPVFASPSTSSKGIFGDAAMSPAASKPPMPSATSTPNKPRLTKRASAAVAAVFRPLHGLFTPEKAASSSSSSSAAASPMLRSRSSSISRSVSRDTTVVDVHDDGAHGLLLLGAASMDSFDGDATVSSPLRERSLSIDARSTNSRRLSSSSSSNAASAAGSSPSPAKAVYVSPSCVRAMAKQKEVVVKVPLSTVPSSSSSSASTSAVPKPMLGQKKPSGSNWTSGGGATSSVMRMVTPASRPSIAMKA